MEIRIDDLNGPDIAAFLAQQRVHDKGSEMIRKIALVTIALCIALVGVGYVMYLANTAPVIPAISAAEVANPSRPFVVKLHAQWCPVCMITTSVWSEIHDEYSGRVNFLVLDFTDEQTTQASRAAAVRAGLGQIFEEAGSTGVVLIVDGRTKEVRASIGGSRDVAEYRVAIDAALAPTTVRSGGAVSQRAASPPLVTQAQYERWQVELSNWGRWGKDDEMGTLNLITPAKRRAAAALVREGFPVSLASNASTEKGIDVPCPVEWAMLTASDAGATDRVAFPCIHGAGATHLDSFAHRFFNGKMWNGYPVSGLVTMENGAARNSVLTMKNGIVTRAVLYDIPRLKGVPYLEPGTRIFPEDLEAWEKKVGVRVAAGDALLLRWGRWARRVKVGPWAIDEGSAGFDNSIIPWLKRRDIALLGWETPGYVPQPAGDLPRTAVHDFALTILGIHLLDRADFEALSEAAASRNRWEFMLTVAPLPIPKGTGSPVNPIAMF